MSNEDRRRERSDPPPSGQSAALCARPSARRRTWCRGWERCSRRTIAGAKWAIGLRAPVTDEEVERACNEGSIIRTHVLRQTWHFVARDDIRWMLALSGPRVNAVNAHYYRKMDLDERTFARSRTVIERALRGGQHLTRPELKAALGRARHRRRRSASGVSDHACRARCGHLQWSQTRQSADVCAARGTCAPREERWTATPRWRSWRDGTSPVTGRRR